VSGMRIQGGMSEIFEMYQPHTLAQSELKNDGPYLVYGANGVIGKHTSYNHEEAQVLVTCRGATCGTINVSAPFSWINGNAMVIKPRKNNVDLAFLKYYLESGIDIKKVITGAAQPQITRQSLSMLKVDLPPFEEQQRIAAILDKTELIKSKRELAIEKLDELAQSIFVEMFGDLVTNPKNFDVIELSKICDLQNGFAFKSDDYIDSSNILNCRMSNIRPNGEFNILYHPKYLPNHYADKYSSFLLNDGDVIIAMTDMAGEPKILGVPTIVDTQGYKLLLNQRVGKLIFKNQQPLSIKYLKYALSQPYVKQYYRKFASGGVQINLGKKDLLSVEILLPSYEKQKVFDDLISKLVTEKEKHVKAHQKIDMISQSIKSIAFSGQL